MPKATVKGVDITKVGPDPRYVTPAPAQSFNLISGVDSAMSYARVGSLAGAGIGCVVGGVATALAGGWGCLLIAPVTSAIGGVSFGVYGFLSGGYGWSSADYFEYGPDVAPNTPMF